MGNSPGLSSLLVFGRFYQCPLRTVLEKIFSQRFFVCFEDGSPTQSERTSFCVIRGSKTVSSDALQMLGEMKKLLLAMSPEFLNVGRSDIVKRDVTQLNREKKGFMKSSERDFRSYRLVLWGGRIYIRCICFIRPQNLLYEI
ncbi:hypothetical protein TNCV_2020481 [Trichonephila clavipes]|nr:hypothetical protein TNCV_2020481 [Trichonephila clavipes]